MSDFRKLHSTLLFLHQTSRFLSWIAVLTHIVDYPHMVRSILLSRQGPSGAPTVTWPLTHKIISKWHIWVAPAPRWCPGAQVGRRRKLEEVPRQFFAPGLCSCIIFVFDSFASSSFRGWGGHIKKWSQDRSGSTQVVSKSLVVTPEHVSDVSRRHLSPLMMSEKIMIFMILKIERICIPMTSPS